MPTEINEVIKEGIKNIAIKTGIELDITDAHVEVIVKGLVALAEVINEATIKKAKAAGHAAANAITTVEQANELLKSAAESEVK